MALRSVTLVGNVLVNCSKLRVQSLRRCMSTLHLVPCQQNILSNKPSTHLLKHLKSPWISFQQPCAAKTYDSITRMNLGRSEEEVQKTDYLYDPETPPLKHKQ